MFDESMSSFAADNISLSLNEEGNAYTLKSAVNEGCLVDLTFNRAAPGFAIGKDGTTYFGTDPQNPWGSMRHMFWPRCNVTGTITTKEKVHDMTGRGMFSQALQGMKPHHAGTSETWLDKMLYASNRDSFSLELHQLSNSVIFRYHDGVHNTTIVRVYRG